MTDSPPRAPTLVRVVAALAALLAACSNVVLAATQDYGCVEVLVRVPGKNKGTQRWVIEPSPGVVGSPDAGAGATRRRQLLGAPAHRELGDQSAPTRHTSTPIRYEPSLACPRDAF
jgi:hypothetical protein